MKIDNQEKIEKLQFLIENKLNSQESSIGESHVVKSLNTKNMKMAFGENPMVA